MINFFYITNVDDHLIESKKRLYYTWRH